ncbi:MAG: hypothetical protein QNJ70_00225 [Xenococcaceae cyanobacterium MO_207.B15]|nr:hypothetical protein [Xenococcaceae cyanobacterium MO_207.B15]
MKLIKAVKGFFAKLSRLLKQASRSKQQAEKIDKLAKQKQLREAINLAEEVLSWWSLHPSFLESLVRWFRLGELLEQLERNIKNWREDIIQVELKASQAKDIEAKDRGNPYETEILLEALQLYQDCNRLNNEPRFIEAITRIEQKLQSRQKFQELMAQGKKEVEGGFYKQALITFERARELFSITELEEQIIFCQNKSQEQDKYENILTQANQIAREGKFQQAISLFEPALAEFPRTDGDQFLSKLKKIVYAKDCFRMGVQAEEAQDFKVAVVKYQETLQILPELTECQMRSAIASIKNNNLTQVFSFLQEINNDQASYLRGLAYAKQRDWKQANREWKNIKFNRVEEQRQIIKTLIERDRLSQIKEIESAVDNNNVEIAKTLSLEFINKFGSDPTIKQNLENHIQPTLERQIWEAQNWQQIAIKTEQIWLEQEDIKSLHNWAISNYYQAQTNPHKLANFIIAWSTALANIKHNPTLQNVPWLGSNSIDIKDVSAKLKQELENAIDAVKDNNIEKYLKLRDIYRRDMVTLSLVQQNNNCGIKIKGQLVILPGCYKYFPHLLSGIRFPRKVWGALYTDWGLAVAACHEGDTARAIKIKPSKNPSSEVDEFAYCFVSYHEGCYYLQNLEWRKAIKPLQQAQSDIENNSDWCKEIDRLCELQRQKIDNFDEHLQFSKFWYELVDSKPSRSYFGEQQAIQIGIKLDDKKISFQQGLNELKKLQQIDPNNSLTLELIKKLEFNLELEKIDRLMKQNQFEEAVRVAKRSSNEQIRFIVAEICLKILLEGLKNNDLPFELINQLGNWAYELCPHEPAFRPLYSQLGIY